MISIYIFALVKFVAKITQKSTIGEVDFLKEMRKCKQKACCATDTLVVGSVLVFKKYSFPRNIKDKFIRSVMSKKLH